MRKIVGIGLLVLLAACASNPYRGSEKIYTKQIRSFSKDLKKKETNAYLDSAGNALASQWVSTVNFNLRKPNYVIIHHTAQKSTKETLKTFTQAKTQVSAHYLIGTDGKVTQLLNDYLRAWHGGVAKWGSISDINSVAIGIELDNNGFEPFDSAQINSLINLLDKLEEDLNKGERKVEIWANSIGVKSVDMHFENKDPFFNINTKEELATAEEILKND